MRQWPWLALSSIVNNCKFANVQPHSRTQANLAGFMAVAPLGSNFMYLDLKHGGHLLHGSHLSLVNKLFNTIPYYLNSFKCLDYEKILSAAQYYKPHIIVAGYSSYPLSINFKKLREICSASNFF